MRGGSSRTTTSGATGGPRGTGNEPELYLLLADWREGRLDPEPVELGELPEDATADMRRVAEDMRLLMGLRLAAGEDRPLPYSTRFAAERMRWGENRKRAQRAIDRLCEASVIEYSGSLPPSGQPYGTRTYSAPLLASAGAVERESVEVEPVVPFEPEHELTDDGVVGGTVLAGAAATRASHPGTEQTNQAMRPMVSVSPAAMTEIRARRTDRGAPRGLGLMTFGKPRDDESVIGPRRRRRATWASCLATCSTWPGQTVSVCADAIIVERGRVRGSSG